MPAHGVREVVDRDPGLAQHLSGDPVIEIDRGEQQVPGPGTGSPSRSALCSAIANSGFMNPTESRIDRSLLNFTTSCSA